MEEAQARPALLPPPDAPASSPASRQTSPAGLASIPRVSSPARPGAATASEPADPPAPATHSIATSPSAHANPRRSAAPAPSGCHSNSNAAASARPAAPDPCDAVPASRSAAVPAAADPAAEEAPSPVAQPPRSNPARHSTSQSLLYETSCSLQTSSSPVPCSLEASRLSLAALLSPSTDATFAKMFWLLFHILSLKLSPNTRVFIAPYPFSTTKQNGSPCSTACACTTRKNSRAA